MFYKWVLNDVICYFVDERWRLLIGFCIVVGFNMLFYFGICCCVFLGMLGIFFLWGDCNYMVGWIKLLDFLMWYLFLFWCWVVFILMVCWFFYFLFFVGVFVFLFGVFLVKNKGILILVIFFCMIYMWCVLWIMKDIGWWRFWWDENSFILCVKFYYYVYY